MKTEIRKIEEVNIEKEIDKKNVEQTIKNLSIRFDLDLHEILKKMTLGKFDSFSLNIDSPYLSLYAGNLTENIVLKIRTYKNEVRIEIPKSDLI